METKKMLEVREKIRKTRPKFVVKESKFSARVKSRWRFPRGKHSKVRQMHKGRPLLVNVGSRSPRLVRGSNKLGLEIVAVSNKNELLSLDKEKQSALLTNIGNKKRLELLELAKENKIHLSNVKDIEKTVEKIKSSFDTRKKLKLDKSQAKSKKETEKKKLAEEKKKKEEEEKTKAESKSVEETVEDKKEKIKEEKKELEKTIIKKQ
jgi:large subunit ribosomal protein L32e